jgi:hypothetical protein
LVLSAETDELTAGCFLSLPTIELIELIALPGRIPGSK